MGSLIDDFKSVYQRLDSSNIDLVKSIYDDDVTFIDPFHEVKGIDTLSNYFRKLYKNLESCQFDFQNVYQNGSSAMITWTMEFKHKSLANKAIEVPGSTEIHFKEKIFYHRDFFDAGKMVYENIPLIGSAIKYIKRQV